MSLAGILSSKINNIFLNKNDFDEKKSNKIGYLLAFNAYISLQPEAEFKEF